MKPTTTTTDKLTALSNALEAWEKLSGAKVNATKTSFRNHEANEQIREIAELDSSGVTTMMLFDAITRQRASDLTFSALEVMENPDKVADTIKRIQAVKSALNHPELLSGVDSFKKALRASLAHYGFITKKVEELLENQEELAFIRRDALRAMKELRVDQFSRGKADAAAPKVNTKLYHAININSLLDIVAGQRKECSLVGSA